MWKRTLHKLWGIFKTKGQRIATIPIGYADGLHKTFNKQSESAYKWTKGTNSG